MKLSWLFLTLFAFTGVSAAKQGAYYDAEDDRLVPLGALKTVGTTSVTFADGKYKFIYSGGDEPIEYHIDTNHSDFGQGILRVKERFSGATIVRGGQRWTSSGGAVVLPVDVPTLPGMTVTLLGHSLVNGIVRVDYKHHQGTADAYIRYEISLEKKSLRIRSNAQPPLRTAWSSNYCGLDLGRMEDVPSSHFLRIPYMESFPVTLFSDNWFVGTFTDPLWSRGVRRQFETEDEGGAQPKNCTFFQYSPMTDNSINYPVDDAAWVTVSTSVEDTFVTTDKYPASPHRIVANKSAVVRLAGWSHFPTDPERTWTAIRAYAEKMYDGGFFSSQVYIWNWNYYFTNVNEPTLFPPKVGLGTSGDWNALQSFLGQRKSTIGLYYIHEEMDQGYSPGGTNCPDAFNGESGSNPSYDPTYICKLSDGSPQQGWDTTIPLQVGEAVCPNGPNGHAVHITAANHYLPYLLRENLLIQESPTYSPNGWPAGNPPFNPQTLSYVDARHNVPLGGIDLEAGTDKVNNMRDYLLTQKGYFAIQKALTGGPLLGEGAIDPRSKGTLELSGYSDGVRAYLCPPSGLVADAQDWWMVPDYELRVMKPLMLNHGMGVEPEYATAEPGESLIMNHRRQDVVRCAEIVYGHGIYPVHHSVSDVHALKGYYMVTADLQPQFGASTVSTIEYWNGNAYVQLKEALLGDLAGNPNLDLTMPKVRITYDNGLIIYAAGYRRNAQSFVPWAISVAGTSFSLDADCWVAHNPTNGFLEFSARVSTGSGGYTERYDYCKVPGKYELIDGRGVDQSFGGLDSDRLLIVWDEGLTIFENPPGEFQVTGPPLSAPYPADDPTPLPVPATNSASTSFRGLQGEYGWFYRVHHGVDVPVPATHLDWWQPFQNYPDLNFDKSTSAYKYPNSNVRVSSTQMTPDVITNPSFDALSAVRGWIALAPGTVQIVGSFRKVAAGGDGVDLSIRPGFDQVPIWAATVAGSDTALHGLNLGLSVSQGDMLLFEASPRTNATADTIEWAPVITYVGAPGAPVAHFSLNPAVPTAWQNVSFTDTSFGSPTAWAWDFESDGIVDSSAQNPTWQFPGHGTYSVRLTTFSAAGSDDEIQVVTVLPNASFVSIAAQDGWIGQIGGATNSTDVKDGIRGGDDSLNSQFKSIVSFATAPTIPSTATLTKATIKLTCGQLDAGALSLGQLKSDIKTGFFGSTNLLEAGDFSQTATRTGVATLNLPSAALSISSGILNASGLAAINKSTGTGGGLTQMRIYLTTATDNDGVADILGFYSGDASGSQSGYRPVLEVSYH